MQSININKLRINNLFSFYLREIYSDEGLYEDTKFILDAGIFTSEDFPYIKAFLEEMDYIVDSKISFAHTQMFVFRQLLETVSASVKLINRNETGEGEGDDLYA